MLRRVKLYAERRISWLRILWQERGPSGGAMAITHAEADGCLAELDSPEAERRWYESDEQMAGINREIGETENQIAELANSRFSFLLRIFGLSREESDIVQLCLAIGLDPGVSRLYAYLQDHSGRGYATEELTMRIFGYGRIPIWNPDSNLARWHIVKESAGGPGEPAMLSCDRFILRWLLGENPLDELLVPLVRFVRKQEPLKNWPLKSTLSTLERILKEGKSQIRVILSGPEGSGRKTLASCLSSSLKMEMLALTSDFQGSWNDIYLHAQRQAILDGNAIAWIGENAVHMKWPEEIPGIPLQFVICGTVPSLPALGNTIDLYLEMPGLLNSEEEELIRGMLPVSVTWPCDRLAALLAQYRLTIGEITGLQSRQVQTPEEAAEFLRLSSRRRLGPLASLLETPFALNDLVVPEVVRDALDDFIYEARVRKQFWENGNIRSLFPQGRGLIALFSGPPGTGKTMAAQVIAAELGLDLYRIDLSAVVSKYVGETSQNLERILSQAARMDIVLLFDEADALFGKRTEVKDAHDRFANTDTSYLLQAIENYRGIAILASNRKENIDYAFIRRLRYVLEFPKPDSSQRELIWRKISDILLSEGERSNLNGQLRQIALNVDLTGAQIKFAMLTALFAAGRDREKPGMKHLLRGISRELMKEGRSITDRERKILLDNE